MELARNSGWRNCPDFTILFQHQLTPWLWSWKLPFVLSQSLHGQGVLSSKWEGSWPSYSGKQQHVEAQDSRKQSCQDLCHHFLWPHHCCIIAFHSWRPGRFGFQFQVCHLERGVGNKKRNKSVPQDSVDHFYRTKRVIYLSHCFSCSQITMRWLPFSSSWCFEGRHHSSNSVSHRTPKRTWLCSIPYIFTGFQTLVMLWLDSSDC